MYLVGNAPYLYPTIIHSNQLYDNNGELNSYIQCEYPFKNEWGISHIEVYNKEWDIYRFVLSWVSIVEKKMYHIDVNLRSMMSNGCQSLSNVYNKIILGMAPYGKLAVWGASDNKHILLGWLEGDEYNNENDEYQSYLNELFDYYVKSDFKIVENIKVKGLPPKSLFNGYMQQYTYRYLIYFEKWGDKRWTKKDFDEQDYQVLEYIEESLYDGTYDKLHDEGLLKYHEAGKPSKIAVKWHKKKSECTAYFWFDETLICEIFEKFYGAHRDTKVDFIIRIDAEQKKYELSLYRYGLKEPFVIPEDAYQLLVFKSKFEHYRSENYNQERGAWIW